MPHEASHYFVNADLAPSLATLKSLALEKDCKKIETEDIVELPAHLLWASFAALEATASEDSKTYYAFSSLFDNPTEARQEIKRLVGGSLYNAIKPYEDELKRIFASPQNLTEEGLAALDRIVNSMINTNDIFMSSLDFSKKFNSKNNKWGKIKLNKTLSDPKVGKSFEVAKGYGQQSATLAQEVKGISVDFFDNNVMRENIDYLKGSSQKEAIEQFRQRSKKSIEPLAFFWNEKKKQACIMQVSSEVYDQLASLASEVKSNPDIKGKTLALDNPIKINSSGRISKKVSAITALEDAKYFAVKELVPGSKKGRILDVGVNFDKLSSVFDAAGTTLDVIDIALRSLKIYNKGMNREWSDLGEYRDLGGLYVSAAAAMIIYIASIPATGGASAAIPISNALLGSAIGANVGLFIAESIECDSWMGKLFKLCKKPFQKKVGFYPIPEDEQKCIAEPTPTTNPTDETTDGKFVFSSERAYINRDYVNPGYRVKGREYPVFDDSGYGYQENFVEFKNCNELYFTDLITKQEILTKGDQVINASLTFPSGNVYTSEMTMPEGYKHVTVKIGPIDIGAELSSEGKEWWSNEGMDEQRALTGDLVYRLETPGSSIKQGIPGSTGGHGDGGYADLGLDSYEWKDNLVLIDPDFAC